MDIGEIIGDSFNYSIQDWKKVIILGIITIISFLIIPIFLVYGYVLRILKATIAGSDELPEFDEWGDMFVDGLKVFLVSLIYFIVPAIIILAGMWTVMIPFMSMSGSDLSVASTAAFALFSGIALVGLLLMIIIYVIYAIAIANMAYYDGEIAAAFRFNEILDHISRIGWVNYIIWFIVMILVSLVIGVVAAILNVLIIGIVVTPLIIAPFALMFYSRSLALIFTTSEH